MDVSNINENHPTSEVLYQENDAINEIPGEK